MKYVIQTASGRTEIREDTGLDGLVVPDGGVEVTDDQHAKLISGQLIFSGGEVVESSA